MTAAGSALEPATVEVVTDLDRLQGAWNSVSGRRQAELLIAGRLFTVRLADHEIYMGSFNICPEERPRAMTMWIDEGPFRHKGKIALCIYALEDNLLRWCAAEPGTEQRPASFPSIHDTHYLNLIFERQDTCQRPAPLPATGRLGRNSES